MFNSIKFRKAHTYSQFSFVGRTIPSNPIVFNIHISDVTKLTKIII